MIKQKLSLTFTKNQEARYLSHHDLMRYMERLVRRADIPVRYTEGFHPHPRIVFPLALGVGISSDCELVELELDSWVRPEDVLEKLNQNTRDGIRFLDYRLLPNKKTGSHIKGLSYSVRLNSSEIYIYPSDITEFLAKKSYEIEIKRKKVLKKVDIRPFVRELFLRESELEMRISVIETRTIRPEHVCQALIPGIDTTVLDVRKLSMDLVSSNAGEV